MRWNYVCSETRFQVTGAGFMERFGGRPSRRSISIEIVTGPGVRPSTVAVAQTTARSGFVPLISCNCRGPRVGC